MERKSISLSKAICLENSIGWLSRIISQEYEMFIVDDNNVELIEETKLLNELALLNKKRNEILDELTKSKMKYEISSYSDNLEFALTNPIFTSPQGYFWSRKWTDSQLKWRSYMRKGIIYNENHYVDVEQAYQLCKPKNPLFDTKSKFDVMLELLIIKLQTYPKLIEGINFKGGLDYLNNCTHQPTKKNTCWETNGENMFIKLLIEAYKITK